MIETVRGKIDPNAMGVTMCHEHFIMDISRIRKDNDSNFNDVDLIKREITKAKILGVDTFIEVTCIDMGRNVEILRYLSEVCDVNIIVSTGYYLDPYHSKEIRNSSIEEIEKIFIKELTIGIENTNIKAGVIGEVATSEIMTDSEYRVLCAAAKAGSKVGCAVTTHCQFGKLAIEQYEILTSNGLNPKKIVLGHLDLADNIEYYEELLSKGVNIGFDTIGKTNYLSDEKRADNLIKLIQLGYVNQIVLSQDISRMSYLSELGEKSGYMTVIKDFIPILIKKGLDRQSINKLLIENPKRIFNIESHFESF